MNHSNSAGWRPGLGALLGPEGVRFRVWAPLARRVEVELGDGRLLEMQAEAGGVWSALLAGGGAGTRYRYRLDRGASFPDPYGRGLPDGVHGPSEVVDLDAHQWRDQDWRGLQPKGLVIYECHVGTATREGTFESLIGQLDRLADLGVTALEILPIAEFPGRRNWGYDGVAQFAPSRAYGGAVAFQRLVDAAHRRGLGVILDVVYNHLGPEGNYLRQFSSHYYTDRYHTPWGEAINYDGPESDRVRACVIDNALSWIHEYHVDGLRLDATFKMYDQGTPHVLQELAETVRRSLPPQRSVVLIAETSENQRRYLLPPEQGGWGYDLVWADDFHHGLRRYLRGDHEGYFQDYQGTLAELARTIQQGFLVEGAWSPARGYLRGTSVRDREAWQLQYCIQNHDQVGNRALGDRLHHTLDLAGYRIASALLLLLPMTPLLFMGQEFAASSPFQFFTDFSPDFGPRVTEGRRREFAAYAAFADPAEAASIPDPQAEQTFLDSRLRLEEIERSPGREIHRLYTELLALRRHDPLLSRQDRFRMRALAISDNLLAVHWWLDGEHRLLLANFGASVALRPADHFKLPPGTGWRVLLDTNEPRFSGEGPLSEVRGTEVRLGGRGAVMMAQGANER